MVFLEEGKAGGKIVPINSGILLLSSMLSKAGKNSLQIPLLNLSGFMRWTFTYPNAHPCGDQMPS